MKYRKKPAIIEAVQYTEYGKLVKGMCDSKSCYVSSNIEPHVHTIHDNQIVLLEVGDFIIPEPDGIHFYPCKPDIFRKTYKAVEDEPTTDVKHTEEIFDKILTMLWNKYKGNKLLVGKTHTARAYKRAYHDTIKIKKQYITMITEKEDRLKIETKEQGKGINFEQNVSKALWRNDRQTNV